MEVLPLYLLLLFRIHFGVGEALKIGIIVDKDDCETKNMVEFALNHTLSLPIPVFHQPNKLQNNQSNQWTYDTSTPFNQSDIREHSEKVKRQVTLQKELFQPIFIEVTEGDNSYTLQQAVCNTMRTHNLLSIFDFYGFIIDSNIKSLAYKLELPYIKIQRDGFDDFDASFTLNYFPDIDDTIVDLVLQYKWQDAVLIYSGDTGFVDIVRLSRKLSNNLIKVNMQEATTPYNIHRMFKLCKARSWGNYIVYLPLDLAQKLLTVALMEGMIMRNHSFIFTNLDARLMDFNSYQYNGVNITAFNLQTDTPANHAIITNMMRFSSTNQKVLFTKSNMLSVSSMLVHDAIHAYVSAVHSLNYSQNAAANRVVCGRDRVLAIGHTLYNYLNARCIGITTGEELVYSKPKPRSTNPSIIEDELLVRRYLQVKAQVTGLTGTVSLNSGVRSDYTIDVLQLVEGHGLIKTQNMEKKRDEIRMSTVIDVPSLLESKNKVLIVTAIKEDPFFMYAANHEGKLGNDKYTGYCVDLLYHISKSVGFKYEIVDCVNCSYGVPDDEGQWGGMVRELIDQKADIAMGSFTINYARQQVIDMTKPFMNVGIGVLYKMPKKQTPGLFYFLAPLAFETWFFIALAYLVVSISLYMIGRFSPYEIHSRLVEADRANDTSFDTKIHLEKYKLTLANSFWFAVGTLVQHGSDVSPSAISTRVIGGFWWLFSLMVISSYTANLAAFLTVERLTTPIENVEQMSLQTDIKYGTLSSGSTMLFFKESSMETYKRMWSFMSANPDLFANSYDEGAARVKQGNYAFLMESANLDYRVQRDCELMQVGGLLDSKGFGFGTQKGSPYRDDFSNAILILQEKGVTLELYDKWWKQPGTCSRDQRKGESTANALDMENVGGMFIILFAGAILAVIAAVMENIYKRKQDAKKKRKGNILVTVNGNEPTAPKQEDEKLNSTSKYHQPIGFEDRNLDSAYDYNSGMNESPSVTSSILRHHNSRLRGHNPVVRTQSAQQPSRNHLNDSNHNMADSRSTHYLDRFKCPSINHLSYITHNNTDQH